MQYGVSGGYLGTSAPVGCYASGSAAAFDYGQGSSAYNPGTNYSSIQSNYSALSLYSSGNNYSTPEFSSEFIAESFLAPQRPWTPIVSKMDDVKEVIEETFELITGQQFPNDDIKIIILSEDNFHKLHTSINGFSNKGVMGFSFNKYGRGTSEIFVKQDHMDSLLLTIGHEIGHVLSYSLPNAKDEEAKAHAFSIAWMETIRENNIGGLQPNIIINPAKNGLHDVAYEFTVKLMNDGNSALEVFKTLSRGLTSIIAEANYYG